MFIIIGGCCCLLALLARALWVTRPSSWSSVMAWYDAMGSGEQQVEAGVPVEGRGWSKLAFSAAMAAKEKFGDMKYTNANRLVVGEFVRKWLRSEHPDLRTVDLVRHATIAIELALLPTQTSVLMAGFSKDVLVRERRATINAAR